MTAVEVLALLLGAGLLVLLAVLIREVRHTASRGDKDRKSVREAAWRSVAALELTQSNTHRLAVAVEKAANDRPAQQEARRLAEQNENLVLGITSILEADIASDEGSREDYAAGHARGVADLKARLRHELHTAMTPTGQ